MSGLSSGFLVRVRLASLSHLTTEPSLLYLRPLISVAFWKSSSTTDSWSERFLLREQSLATVELPLLQFLELMATKNSVIRRVFNLSQRRGIPVSEVNASLG